MMVKVKGVPARSEKSGEKRQVETQMEWSVALGSFCGLLELLWVLLSLRWVMWEPLQEF